MAILLASNVNAQETSNLLLAEFHSKGFPVSPEGMVTISSSNGDQRDVIIGPISRDESGMSSRVIIFVERFPRGTYTTAICANLPNLGLPNVVQVDLDNGPALVVGMTVVDNTKAGPIIEQSNKLHNAYSNLALGPKIDQLAPDNSSRIKQLKIQERRLESEVKQSEKKYNYWDGKSGGDDIMPAVYANQFFGRWKNAELQLMNLQDEIANLESN